MHFVTLLMLHTYHRSILACMHAAFNSSQISPASSSNHAVESTFNYHDVVHRTLNNHHSHLSHLNVQAMPDAASKSYLRQANKVLSVVGRKTALGAAIGFAFCYTEATVENMRGKHDMISGMAGGAAAGFVFAMIPPKPLPQPVAWPLAFAAAAALTDIVTEKIPEGMKDFRYSLSVV